MYVLQFVVIFSKFRVLLCTPVPGAPQGWHSLATQTLDPTTESHRARATAPNSPRCSELAGWYDASGIGDNRFSG